MKSPNFHDTFGDDWPIFGGDERLADVFDLEVVEKGFEVVLGGEADVKQETIIARPFSEAPIVEHLQVVVNTPSLYRQEKSIITPQIYPSLPTSAKKEYLILFLLILAGIIDYFIIFAITNNSFLIIAEESMMEYEGNFVMQKNVDWSMLNDGFTIPIAAYSLFGAWDKSLLTHGQVKDIKILIGGEFYDAKLKNQNFNQANHAGHKDIIQIRYSRSSPIAIKLRAIFKKSFDYYVAKRLLQGKSKRKTPLPDDFKEYIRLYLTTSPNVICLDCCSNDEYIHLANALSSIPEEIYEAGDDDKFFAVDKSASIVEKKMLVKYRKIDRSIIRMLKEFYDYRDEISGEKIGNEYGGA